MIVTNNTSRMAKLHFESIFLGRPLPRPGGGSNLSVVVARASWGLRTAGSTGYTRQTVASQMATRAKEACASCQATTDESALAQLGGYSL